MLQDHEHDDTEQQQQRLRSHHDKLVLVRRFLYAQLPKIIIARLEEWESRIVPAFWHTDDLVAAKGDALH
jgi:hypothetical protein